LQKRFVAIKLRWQLFADDKAAGTDVPPEAFITGLEQRMAEAEQQLLQFDGIKQDGGDSQEQPCRNSKEYEDALRENNRSTGQQKAAKAKLRKLQQAEEESKVWLATAQSNVKAQADILEEIDAKVRDSFQLLHNLTLPAPGSEDCESIEGEMDVEQQEASTVVEAMRAHFTQIWETERQASALREKAMYEYFQQAMDQKNQQADPSAHAAMLASATHMHEMQVQQAAKPTDIGESILAKGREVIKAANKSRVQSKTTKGKKDNKHKGGALPSDAAAAAAVGDKDKVAFTALVAGSCAR
jgi:hypothetical protein